MRAVLLTVIAAVLPSVYAIPSRRVALSSRQTIAPEADRAAAVKEAFEHAWNGYYTYAFPKDELLPVSNTGGNSRNGWGASAVDALSTAILMEEKTIIQQILDHIAQIDYTQTNDTCSLFETTIRYLGGMLAGYDLLTGPYASLGFTQDQTYVLLNKSIILADTLAFAFDTPTGIPYNDLNITAKTSPDGPQNGLATIGTLVLEWQRLSDLTGNPKYGELAQKGESYLLAPQPSADEPFPGLVGSDVAINTGQFLDNSGGWVGGSDSFYEYLIKMYVYDKTRFQTYLDRWLLAADSSIKYLASTPATGPNVTYLAEFSGTTPVLSSQHLACFDGGNFILGGLVLGNNTLQNFGLKLVEGCRNSYNSTASGIGPETFAWDPSSVPADQQSFYQTHGFYITNSIYDLRPEYVESVYYAYRATGDSKYQDYAWEAFLNINRTTRTNSGFSLIDDVNSADGGTKGDLQESFFFAELMKYLYLIFAADGPVQVQGSGSEEWVFNTEAHPFKVVTVAK